MRLELTGRNVDVSAPLRQLIERKISKIDRMLHDRAVSAQVVLTQEKYRRRIELTVYASGDHILRGVGTGTAWAASLTEAFNKVEQQALRLKDRRDKRKRRATGTKALELLPAPAPVVADTPPSRPARARRVIRSQRYTVSPLTVEEALDQLQRAEDPFVVFRNRVSQAVCVLHRRKDGHFGLIESEA